ncbi:ABC transporter substrate-binding protein [Terrilactibacillus laevilacticus]|uniref:ABC transporter substrate-binding protein n=1 Tax=Terrilactibacillus laevilacticus TaxID=1380157 RepID=A0ABW5PN74_9BACI|nr:ABC transporter substrate-binding protein [Terrilactibacillus laevilacticus]
MKKTLTLIISIIMLFSITTACAKNSNAPSSKKDSKYKVNSSLTVAISADQGTLDPAVTMDNSAWKITYPAYERLVDFDGESTNVKAGLAKDWSVSKDGKTWTFHLNSGHKFSDDTPVDAKAVKFSFERLLKVAKGPASVYSEISKVEAPTSDTVEFTLKQNFPPFLSTLAANYVNIVNPKVMDKEKDGDMGQGYLANHTMGSGPYQLTTWKKGEYIQLGLNPHSTVKPALKKVTFKIVSDSSAQKLQLQKGDVDIAEGVPVDQIESLKSVKNVTLLQKPSLLVDYVYINSSKGNEALKNKKVRQALNYGIDYPSLIKAVQQGYATQSRGPIPKGLWGYDNNAKQYQLDADKAKSLLKEAGVSNVTLNLLYSDNNTWWETEALTIQSQLANIGVKVKLNKVAYATSRDMMDKGEFDLALGVWSPDFADPFAFMNFWYDSKNFGLAGDRAFYKNAKVDQLLAEAATSNDQSKREVLYKNIQKIVIDDAPYILLYQKDYLLPMNKNVKGFEFNPMLQGIYNLQDMSK